MSTELTIIIPTKNEQKNIFRVLRSIFFQTYTRDNHPKIFVADAGSTDLTTSAARAAADMYGLNVEIIQGGLPAVGRNAGAKRAESRYLLFLDADVEIPDQYLIERAIQLMRAKGLHCATTNIACPYGAFRSKLAYAVNNFYQRGSRFFGTPFSTGMCMFFSREVFNQLGGFNEKALFAEDYMLSKRVKWNRFRVVPGYVTTSDRRFQKMGYWKLAKLFLGTALFSHRESQFTKDHGYWR